VHVRGAVHFRPRHKPVSSCSGPPMFLIYV
jgi:hypothetical protein